MGESALKSSAGADHRYSDWLNRFAWLTATATLLLICSGGMVTSKGVGLAVPDWPTTFGYNMFLFPVSKWVGGIFFEHTHRLIASIVGFLTIILAVWIWVGQDRQRSWREPSDVDEQAREGARAGRRVNQSIRNLGLIAVAGVVLQGILGGLRVTMLKDEIGIFHACLAQAFLGLIVVIALMTTNFWRSLSNVTIDLKTFAPLKTLALATTIAIYVQLALGATMRHQHRDLAILDFPTANGTWIPDTSPNTLAQLNSWRAAIPRTARKNFPKPGRSSRRSAGRGSSAMSRITRGRQSCSGRPMASRARTASTRWPPRLPNMG